LERELNIAARDGFVPQKIEMIPNGLSVVFFAHLTLEQQEAVAMQPPQPASPPSRTRVKAERKEQFPVEDRKEIFDAWAEAFKKPRTRYRAGSDRDKKIVKALKQYSKDDLMKSIKGHSMNAWRHGEPNRNELATLLRHEQNIEAGMEIFDKGGIKDDFERTAKGNRTIDFSHDNGGSRTFDSSVRNFTSR